MDTLELVLKVLGIAGIITGSIVTVIRTIIWAYNVISAVETLKQASLKQKQETNFLKSRVLKTLDVIRAEHKKDQHTTDHRLDRIERKVNYLFGRTKVTIPPKD